MKYVAFLRGINVGGHKLIKMDELTSIFSSFGLKNVKTLLQSGNVIFEVPTSSTLVKKIESGLLKSLGYEVKVILRSIDEIEAMIALDPFKQYEASKDTKLYVTLLPEAPSAMPKLPYVSEKEGFEIIQIEGGEIYTVTHRLKSDTFGSLAYIEKTFGKYSTTRNWNTILKLV
ncbi:MAG TPA: DUF1697 domain-containing protein [Candidatus Kapabacteria bacterium]|nr:DUF1697 domain-containing protein [Candidatus Kapabacteria bacterium]